MMPSAGLPRTSAVISWDTKAEKSSTGLDISMWNLPSRRRRVEQVEVRVDTTGDLKIWSRTGE